MFHNCHAHCAIKVRQYCMFGVRQRRLTVSGKRQRGGCRQGQTKDGLVAAGSAQSDGPKERDVGREGKGFMPLECAVLGSDLCEMACRSALRAKNKIREGNGAAP